MCSLIFPNHRTAGSIFLKLKKITPNQRITSPTLFFWKKNKSQIKELQVPAISKTSKNPRF